MRLNLKNLSILQQTLVLFGGFLLLAFINFWVINSAKNDIMSFSHKIVEVQKLNDDIEKLNTNAQMAMMDDKSAKTNLEPLISFIDQSINSFKYGGVLTFTKIEVDEADLQLRRVLDKFETSWSTDKNSSWYDNV